LQAARDVQRDCCGITQSIHLGLQLIELLQCERDLLNHLFNDRGINDDELRGCRRGKQQGQ
jgi:hypothetical protein